MGGRTAGITGLFFGLRHFGDLLAQEDFLSTAGDIYTALQDILGSGRLFIALFLVLLLLVLRLVVGVGFVPAFFLLFLLSAGFDGFPGQTLDDLDADGGTGGSAAHLANGTGKVPIVIAAVAACLFGAIVRLAILRAGLDDVGVDAFPGLAGFAARPNDDLLVGVAHV